MVFLVGSLITVTGLYNAAELNRKAADKRFTEARDMANFMLFDLYDELAPVSGNSAALQVMADRARRYLDDLSQSSRSEASLELETIKGYHRLANIEGNPIGLNLGRRDRAEAMLTIADERLSVLGEALPDDADVIRELARLNFSQSVYAYIAKDDSELSIEYAQRSVDHFDRLIALDAAGLEDHIWRLGAQQMIAKPLIWIGRSGEAVTRYHELETEMLALEAKHPEDAEVEYTVATFYTDFAEVSSWHVYLEGAPADTMIRVADEGVARIEAVVARDEESIGYRRSRAMAYIRRAAIMSDIERFEQAIKDLQIARQIAVELNMEDPDSKSIELLFSAIDSQLMSDLASTERYAEAIEVGEGMLAQAARNYQSEPENPGYWRTYFLKNQMVGETYLSAGDFVRACANFIEAAEVGARFDDEIGISEADRQNAYDDLLLEAAACRDGTISEFELQ